MRSNPIRKPYGMPEARDATLAMVPSLLYMMDGTGGMPTKLVVRSRILDARTGRVLWDVKQSACSEPGPDIDLAWNTIEGEPAQRCRVIADCLAQRFAGFLVSRSKKRVGSSAVCDFDAVDNWVQWRQ